MSQNANVLRGNNWTAVRDNSPKGLQKNAQDWKQWLIPHVRVRQMTAVESKGVFLPWPLLAIVVTLAIVLVSGLVTLEVQVSNLSTTLLLRDADHGRQLADLKDQLSEVKTKNEQLQVYITNDREKLITIQTRLGIGRN
ncbi:MAG TPA: hypothetical protein VIX17_11510 [Pyrinomonadaceae bacterium]|jgi:hypothetical protein